MRTRIALIVIAAVVAAACGQTGSGGGSSPAGSGGASVAPATPTVSGLPSSPSPSPIAAGPTGQIAFLRPETMAGEGQVDVYLVDAAGAGTPRRLTNDDRVEMAIWWLNDGSRLVYASGTYADPYHQTLTSIRPDGTESKDLGPVQTVYYRPSPSPDGRFVVFGGDGAEDGSSGLVLLDLRDGLRTKLTTDGATEPIWSPDGRRVLARLPLRGLEIVDLETKTVTATIKDPDVQWTVGWTGDGQSVLFHSCGDDLGKTECMNAPTLAADADGTNVRAYKGPLPADPNEPLLASPDGQWIASWADWTLMVTPASGGAAVTLGSGESPAWSADSEWLVYRGTAAQPTATSEWLSEGLFVVHRGGGEPIQLTDRPYDQGMAWRP